MSRCKSGPEGKGAGQDSGGRGTSPALEKGARVPAAVRRLSAQDRTQDTGGRAGPCPLKPGCLAAWQPRHSGEVRFAYLPFAAGSAISPRRGHIDAPGSGTFSTACRTSENELPLRAEVAVARRPSDGRTPRRPPRPAMSALRRLRPFDASGPDFTRQPLTAWRQRSRLNPREAHRTAVRAVRRGPVIDAVVRQGIAKSASRFRKRSISRQRDSSGLEHRQRREVALKNRAGVLATHP